LSGETISTYILPAILALIMFNLGLSLTFQNFSNIFKQPKALITGLVCQIIFLPLIAFCIAGLSNLPFEFKMGIILIAICPGGATSNLITYLLKGNVALSISMTSVNSILILITIPLYLLLGISIFANNEKLITLPFFNTIANVFIMIIIPVIIGLTIKNKYPTTAQKIENILKYISIILLAFVFGLAILLNKNGDQSLLIYYKQVFPYVVTLNIVGMLTGLLAGKLFQFKRNTLVTLPIEVGIQNSTLAITLAISSSFLNNPLMSVPATIYGMFTFFSALLFGFIVNKIFKD